MSQTPNDLNDPGRNRDNGNGVDDAAPRKRGGALLWLLLLVALLLLGWWWFSQRSSVPETAPEPAPGTATGEPAATAAADAEKAAAEARKKSEQARAKPSKPSKPAIARATEARPLAGSPQPEYPRDAQRRGQGGRVLLRVDVAADGTTTNVDFVKRSGTPELDRAAMNAVRKWRFAPARLNGKPVASSVNVPIDFVLPKS